MVSIFLNFLRSFPLSPKPLRFLIFFKNYMSHVFFDVVFPFAVVSGFLWQSYHWVYSLVVKLRQTLIILLNFHGHRFWHLTFISLQIEHGILTLYGLAPQVQYILIYRLLHLFPFIFDFQGFRIILLVEIIEILSWQRTVSFVLFRKFAIRTDSWAIDLGLYPFKLFHFELFWLYLLVVIKLRLLTSFLVFVFYQLEFFNLLIFQKIEFIGGLELRQQ